MSQEAEAVHADIRELVTGSMMCFPSDVPLPEGWQQCDGHTVRVQDHAPFVNLMNSLFVHKDYKVMNPVHKVTLESLKKYGFKTHKDAIVLPDFRGHESELSFGVGIDGIDIIIGIKVGSSTSSIGA